MRMFAVLGQPARGQAAAGPAVPEAAALAEVSKEEALRKFSFLERKGLQILRILHVILNGACLRSARSMVKGFPGTARAIPYLGS